jgi:hypothetical protein
MEIKQLIDDIETFLSQDISYHILSPFTIKHHAKNQLLFFYKPGAFFPGGFSQKRNLFNMVAEKFAQHQVEVAGVMLLSGKQLEEYSIMDRHYGYINKLSRTAGQILTTDELDQIGKLLAIGDIGNYRVLGGHEFLQNYPEFDEISLNRFWAEKKSLKLRSGFYFQEYTVEQDRVILVNGFHPEQLRVYTAPAHRVIVFLVNSDTDWHTLKHDLAGDTFPERAVPHSIRGEIFKNRDRYGIPNPSISSNTIHLSAGPFEALFEINNFLQHINEIGFKLDNTTIARRFNDAGLKMTDTVHCLKNPVALVDGTSTDLFTATEDMDTREAVTLYQAHFSESRD